MTADSSPVPAAAGTGTQLKRPGPIGRGTIPTVKHTAKRNYCPACGPVPDWARSTYCRHHATELWTQYLAVRETRVIAPSRS
jgi:hypothetical protein